MATYLKTVFGALLRASLTNNIKQLIFSHFPNFIWYFLCFFNVTMRLFGDAKAKFLQQANLVGCYILANFTTIMATMTVHIFPSHTHCDQKQYFKRHLRKSSEMKVRVFTTSLI